jgi:hypothetical protein
VAHNNASDPNAGPSKPNELDPKKVNPRDADFNHDAADVHRPGGFPAEKSNSRKHQTGGIDWPSTATGGPSSDVGANDYGTVGGRGSRG